MHPNVLCHRDAIAELCRRHGVTRLEVFGSAARGDDFDPARSDVDLLVEFGPDVRQSFDALFDFEEAVTQVLGRKVDLIERGAVERSRNYIRRANILGDAELLYAESARAAA